MAEEKKHHFSCLHKKVRTTVIVEEIYYKKEEKHHKRLEITGGVGAASAGAYALVNTLREQHQAKKHPANAHKHKTAQHVAVVAAVAAGGFAFHERHEKKHAKKHAKNLAK